MAARAVTRAAMARRKQTVSPPRCIDMMASWCSAPSPEVPERASQAQIRGGVEAGFRGALVDSFERLDLCDRNLLRLHHGHGRGVAQLAAMLSTHPATVARQLARLRERLLRDTRRGLAARLPLDGDELDRLIDLARRRFDLAIARVLRA
jgi:RNA polymerase sigma-70 factor (ECF subfamily)